MKVVLLGQDSANFRLIASELGYSHDVYLLMDTDFDAFKRLKNRIRKRGFLWGINHVVFLIYMKIIGWFSREFKAELDNGSLKVENTNDFNIEEFIRKENISVIVICTNRIISKKFISNCKDIPIYNIHVGYLPNYRGVYGGFWALYNGEIDKVGVTVHLVEAGIDTGGIVFKDTLSKIGNSGFLNLPILQIKKALESQQIWLKECPVIIESNSDHFPIYFHPTMTEFLRLRFKGLCAG